MRTLNQYLETIPTEERLNIRKTLGSVGQLFNQYAPGFVSCPKHIYVTTAKPPLFERFPQMDDAPPSEERLDPSLRDDNDNVQPFPNAPPTVIFNDDDRNDYARNIYDITPLNSNTRNGPLHDMRTPVPRNDNNPVTRELNRLRAMDRQRMGRTITTEMLLGVYISDERKIVLYERGINWSRRKSPKALRRLFEVVLIHELVHWMTHQMGMVFSATWSTKRYSATDEYVHEGWAQLITWWLVQHNPELRQSFVMLNDVQRSPYHYYRKFVNIPPEYMMQSLEYSRVLGWPVHAEDWYDVIPLTRAQHTQREKELFIRSVESWL